MGLSTETKVSVIFIQYSLDKKKKTTASHILAAGNTSLPYRFFLNQANEHMAGKEFLSGIWNVGPPVAATTFGTPTMLDPAFPICDLKAVLTNSMSRFSGSPFNLSLMKLIASDRSALLTLKKGTVFSVIPFPPINSAQTTNCNLHYNVFISFGQ